MLKTYEYKIYPTKEQEILLAKHFGCVRLVYNKALYLELICMLNERRILPNLDVSDLKEYILKELCTVIFEGKDEVI